MKAALFFALIVSLALLTRPSLAEEVPSHPQAARQAQDWVSTETRDALLLQLNRERERHGLRPLREQAQLSQAAQSHADYLARNGLAGHEQRRGQPGFSGERPYQRAIAAGYALPRRAQLRELYVIGLRDSAAALQQLLSGPYHRHLLLAPQAQELGIGLSAQPGLVMALAGGAEGGEGWLLWPSPEQREVETAACCERPRPAGLEDFGMPVSIQALNDAPLRIDRFELIGADGHPVATQLLQAGTDPHLRPYPQVAYLLPLQALHPGQRYEVRAEARAGDATLQRRWHFDTRP